MTNYAQRPCRSQQPRTCPYHRNGVLAEGARKTAMMALDLKDGADAYMVNMERARKYQALQDAINAGDKTAVDATREEIAKENFPHKPAYASKKSKHHTPVTFTPADWQKFQERADKREVNMSFDNTTVDSKTGNISVHGLAYDGEHNDVLALQAYTQDARRNSGVSLNQERQKMEAAQLAKWEKTVVAAKQGQDTSGWFAPSLEDMKSSAQISDVRAPSLQQVQADRQRQREIADQLASDAKHANRFNPNALSPRDQRERLGDLAEFDTPTEHVATIPGFEDFKKMFGFGKKK